MWYVLQISKLLYYVSNNAGKTGHYTEIGKYVTFCFLLLLQLTKEASVKQPGTLMSNIFKVCTLNHGLVIYYLPPWMLIKPYYTFKSCLILLLV